MSNSYDAKILAKTQEEVSRLNTEMKKLHRDYRRACEENDRLKPAHDYYMMLQKAAMSDDNIMDVFQNLMILVKLSQEDDTPGLTSEQHAYGR